MRQLARTVLWAAFDDIGKVIAQFQVAEDASCVDGEGKGIAIIPFSKIGIIHPLQMKEEDRKHWIHHFSDYEIIPHFPQLLRPFYRPTADEQEQSEITRYKGRILNGKTLKWGLEKDQWVAWSLRDTGLEIDRSYKIIKNANITAFISYRMMMIPDYDIEQEINEIYFFTQVNPLEELTSDKTRLKIKDVEPVVVSEVLRIAEELLKPS